jgi:hypothetical protein
MKKTKEQFITEKLDYLKNNKVLVSYVRDSNNNPYGVIVATGKGKVGWSLLHRKDKENHVWNRNYGLALAIQRSSTNMYDDIKPDSIFLKIIGMRDRSIKYFKE